MKSRFRSPRVAASTTLMGAPDGSRRAPRWPQGMPDTVGSRTRSLMVCMYVCMDGCMYVCMYAWMYVCMYVCVYIYV